MTRIIHITAHQVIDTKTTAIGVATVIVIEIEIARTAETEIGIMTETGIATTDTIAVAATTDEIEEIMIDPVMTTRPMADTIGLRMDAVLVDEAEAEEDHEDEDEVEVEVEVALHPVSKNTKYRNYTPVCSMT